MEQMLEKTNELINEQKYEDALKLLEKFTMEMEKKYEECSVTQYSFNHIVEPYYYEVFKNDGREFEYAKNNVNIAYRMLGLVYMNLNNNIKAMDAYKKALEWNPVDMETLFQLGELYKKVHNLEELKRVTFEAYNYCCTKATMARFYRNLGFYYVEKFKPETATALYQYSQMFYRTKQADNELTFISKATHTPIPECNLLNLNKVLKQENIPLFPNNKTLGITYKVGKLELEAGRKDNARDCFTMIFDLTEDEEVKKILEEQL